jgi:hypothetical protein
VGTRRLRSTALASGAVGAAILSLALAAASPSAASPLGGPTGLMKHPTHSAVTSLATTDDGDDNGESEEIMDRAEQYAAVRTAPGTSVSSQAFTAAHAAAQALPLATGSWKELTNQPYNSDALGYRDPFWSNSSGGAGLVSGRMSAIAVDGSRVYAGAADGGVWLSTDKGQHWTPAFDTQSNLSIGAIAVNPADHSVWVGTGEANTAFENYAGDGIYRSADGGHTWGLVGDRLDNSLVSRIIFDGNGNVLVATSRGLLRRSTIDLGSAWQTVLKPDPNPTGSPYRTSWISDVRVRPGTNGMYVVAVLGWRGSTLAADLTYNGFYVSTTGGTAGSFSLVTAKGISSDIGRASLDYSSNGNKLYAIVESSATLGLNGVYRSDTGTAVGPWKLVADNDELAASPNSATGNPGGQAWYDQYVTVDPKDPSHVYVGLTEVYETSDAGRTWTTIGPYWNFGKPCWSFDPAVDTCPDTTHPDQHAAFVASDGTAYFGNDGGMYSRPASLRGVVKWNDLNATMHSLQYYYAGIGHWPGTNGDGVWGGLQDNGTSLLKPGANVMVSPFGGDGGDVIIDPNNAKRAANEYVDLVIARTQNGGVSDGSTRVYTNITPTCASVIGIEFNPQPCDPNPRFIAPYTADTKNIDHWVAGGQFVWDNQGAGWDTVCNDDTCDWQPVRDLGAGAQSTAIGVVGSTIYAGWCGNGCNPGGAAPFVSGIDTNAGGTWHRVSSANLPNRIPTSFYVDPSNAKHVFVVYGAFSRRWIPGAGVGHVFESTNGGTTWTDRSGNLPDAPVNDVLVFHGKLVVGTDVGTFVTAADSPGSWSRLGAGLPNASTNDLVVAPSGKYLLAATHGRGLWTLAN